MSIYIFLFNFTPRRHDEKKKKDNNNNNNKKQSPRFNIIKKLP